MRIILLMVGSVGWGLYLIFFREVFVKHPILSVLALIFFSIVSSFFLELWARKRK